MSVFGVACGTVVCLFFEVCFLVWAWFVGFCALVRVGGGCLCSWFSDGDEYFIHLLKRGFIIRWFMWIIWLGDHYGFFLDGFSRAVYVVCLRICSY